MLNSESIYCNVADQQIMDQSDEVSLDINEIANSLREQLKIKKAFPRHAASIESPND